MSTKSGEPTQQTIEDWARTVKLTQPIRFGDLERQILARPLPPLVVRENRLMGLRFAIAGLILGAMHLAPFAPLFLLPDANDIYASDEGMVPAGLLASIGGVMPIVWLFIWGAFGRQRNAYTMTAAIAMPIITISAWLLLRASDLEITNMVGIWTLIGVASSVLLCVLVFAASKPAQPEPANLAERTRVVTDEDAGHLRERTIALQMLYRRGLVDADTYRRAIDMPLGSWGELDTENQQAAADNERKGAKRS